MTEPWGRRAAACAVLAAAVFTLHLEPVPLGPPGIDPGWQWIVNHAAGEGWTFGTDVVFTYGPLGWIACPQDVGGHIWWAAAFEIGLQGLLAAALLAALARSTGVYRAVIAAACLWVAADGLGLRFEGRVVLVVVALCAHGVETGRRWSTVAAGLLTGLVPFVKMSLGIAAAATLAVAVLLAARSRGWRSAFPPMTAAIVTLLATAAATIGGPHAIVLWLLRSLEVVSGYSAAGSIIGPRAALWAGATILAAALGAAVALAGKGGAGHLVLVALPGLLVHFRLAFVRQDGHQYLFIPFVVGLLAVLAAWLPVPATRRWWAPPTAAVAVVLVASLAGALPWRPMEVPTAMACRVSGPGALSRLAHPGRTVDRLEQASRRNLEPLAIPDSWRERILASGERVAVVPWEVMYAPANGLPLAPLPTMQLYSAYTASLDAWSSELFSGEAAPGWVLDDFAPVGKRRALLDAPATWQALFRHYRVAAVRWEPFLMLLERRARPIAAEMQILARTTVDLRGVGVRTPAAPRGLLFARVEPELNLLGQFSQRLFRVPLIMTHFHHTDGAVSRCRLIPATAPAGILVDPFPFAVDDYAGLWTGQPAPPVERVRFSGPGLRYYKPKAAVTWTILPLPTAGAGASG